MCPLAVAQPDSQATAAAGPGLRVTAAPDHRVAAKPDPQVTAARERDRQAKAALTPLTADQTANR